MANPKGEAHGPINMSISKVPTPLSHRRRNSWKRGQMRYFIGEEKITLLVIKKSRLKRRQGKDSSLYQQRPKCFGDS
ncbi:hypothetical protein JHK86_025307 [Glycine max]|nr:hypothetical protein JHK86_025307 [Glycine max]